MTKYTIFKLHVWSNLIILSIVMNIQNIYTSQSQISITKCDLYNKEFKMFEGRCVRACRSSEYFSKEKDQCEYCSIEDKNSFSNNSDYHVLTSCSIVTCPSGTVKVWDYDSWSNKCKSCQEDKRYTLFEGKCFRKCSGIEYFSIEKKKCVFCPIRTFQTESSHMLRSCISCPICRC